LDHDIHFEDIVKVMKEYGYEIKQPKGGSSRCSFVKPGCMTCSDSLDDLLELAKDAKETWNLGRWERDFAS
jgi:hypothetical protein